MMHRVTSLLPLRENQSKPESREKKDKPWSRFEMRNSTTPSSYYSAVLATELQMLNEPSFIFNDDFSRRVEYENFWPTTLDKESERAARILRSFCKDGFYAVSDQNQDQSPRTSLSGPRPLMIIPQKIIQDAVGLAIVTVSRAGLWISGAGGSGVIIARRKNREWGPPVGILLQTARLSFEEGVNVYDCIIVINDYKTLGAFSSLRTTLGKEVQISSGPLVEINVRGDSYICTNSIQPAFTYLKSCGIFTDLNMDGTVILERVEENKRFYGHRISANKILSEKIQHSSREITLLLEVTKSLEGRTDTSQQVLEQVAEQSSPSDKYSPRSSSFGIPEAEDPFGVVALERAGLEIRESGTRSRPSSTQFEYHPSPTSPLFARFNRGSLDTSTTRSFRGSFISTRARTSIDRGTQTTTMFINSDDSTTSSVSLSDSESKWPISAESVQASNEINHSKIDHGFLAHLEQHRINHKSKSSSEGTLKIKKIDEKLALEEPIIAKDEDAYNHELDDEDDELVIFEAAPLQATVLQSAKKAGGSLVQIPKRGPPPPVPARSASRGTIDSSTLYSLRNQFEKIEYCNVKRKSYDDKMINCSRLATPYTITPLRRLHENLGEKDRTSGILRPPTQI